MSVCVYNLLSPYNVTDMYMFSRLTIWYRTVFFLNRLNFSRGGKVVTMMYNDLPYKSTSKVLSLSIRGATDDIDRLIIQIWQVKGIF